MSLTLEEDKSQQRKAYGVFGVEDELDKSKAVLRKNIFINIFK